MSAPATVLQKKKKCWGVKERERREKKIKKGGNVRQNKRNWKCKNSRKIGN